jgi:hypothetical protein
MVSYLPKLCKSIPPSKQPTFLKHLRVILRLLHKTQIVDNSIMTLLDYYQYFYGVEKYCKAILSRVSISCGVSRGIN